MVGVSDIEIGRGGGGGGDAKLEILTCQVGNRSLPSAGATAGISYELL